MITEWQLYLITRLDSLGVLCGFLIFGLIVVTLVAALIGAVSWAHGEGYGEEDSDYRRAKAMFAFMKKSLLALLAVSLIGVLTPSTKEALIIYGVPKILQNQKETLNEAGKVPSKAMKLLNEYLDEQLKKDKPHAAKAD